MIDIFTANPWPTIFRIILNGLFIVDGAGFSVSVSSVVDGSTDVQYWWHRGLQERGGLAVWPPERFGTEGTTIYNYLWILPVPSITRGLSAFSSWTAPCKTKPNRYFLIFLVKTYKYYKFGDFVKMVVYKRKFKIFVFPLKKCNNYEPLNLRTQLFQLTLWG